MHTAVSPPRDWAQARARIRPWGVRHRGRAVVTHVVRQGCRRRVGGRTPRRACMPSSPKAASPPTRPSRPGPRDRSPPRPTVRSSPSASRRRSGHRRGLAEPVAAQPLVARPQPQASRPAPETGPARPVLIWARVAEASAPRFLAELAALGHGVTLQPGLWLVQARGGASALRNRLSRSLGPADTLLVVEAAAGTGRLVQPRPGPRPAGAHTLGGRVWREVSCATDSCRPV